MPRSAKKFLYLLPGLLLILLLVLRDEPAELTESKDQLSSRESVVSDPAKTRFSSRKLQEKLDVLLESPQGILRPHPLLEEGRLANRFRYKVLPCPGSSQQISLRLMIDVGSLMETEQELGLAHFIEHLAFNGSKNFPQGQVMEAMQRIGLTTGAHVNASTGIHIFGRLPARETNFPSPLEEPPSLPPSQKITKYSTTGNSKLSLYRGMWPIQLIDLPPEKVHHLDLLGEILANRIRTRIREELTITYSPRLRFIAMDFTSDLNYFATEITSESRFSLAVQNAVQEVSQSFLESPISDDEFVRAIKPIMKWRKLRENSPAYWTSFLSQAARSSQGIDVLKSEDLALSSITREELQTLALEIITPGPSALIAGPPEE